MLGAREMLAAAIAAFSGPFRREHVPALRTVEPAHEHVIPMKLRKLPKAERVRVISKNMAHNLIGITFCEPWLPLPSGFLWKQDRAGEGWRIYRDRGGACT